MIAQKIFASFFFFCSVVTGAADDLEKLTMEDLDKAVKIYRSRCYTDEQGKSRPKSESKVFGFVTELREAFPCEGDKKGVYLYFPSSILYGKGAHNGNDFSFRLDIEGEAEKKMLDTGTKKYVRLQLQNHTGTNNSYASILVPTDIPVHVNLLYLSLQLSCVKYFNGEKSCSKSFSSYESIEDMENYPDGKAHKPQDIYLDDPIFTEKNEHTHQKLERIRERGAAVASLNEVIKQFSYLQDNLRKILKSVIGHKQKTVALNNFAEQFAEFKKGVGTEHISKESAEFIKDLAKVTIQEKVEHATLGKALDNLWDSLRRDLEAFNEKNLRDIKHAKRAQEQKRKQLEEAAENKKLPKKDKWVRNN